MEKDPSSSSPGFRLKIILKPRSGEKGYLGFRRKVLTAGAAMKH